MRTLVRLVTVVAVALGVTFVHMPMSQAVTVPETLADRRPVGVGPVVPPFSIDYLGVLWETSGAPDEHAAEQAAEHGAVRFRIDGSWTAWQPLTGDGAHAEGQWASALVPVGDAEAYQVRGIPAGARAPRAVALNTTDGPPREVGRVPAGGAHAVPNCLSRAEWGADERLRFDSAGQELWPAEFSPAQTMSVHHTATANDDPDPAATVRAIYRYHAVDRGWGDIGYHYLIDPQGRVYEGRWSGAASAPCGSTSGGNDFAHDAAGRLVTGAHSGGYNSGNMGASLLGTFTNTTGGAEPSSAAVDGLETLLAEFAARHGLDPRAVVEYVNPVNGSRKTVNMISGHRDWLATECPGERLYDDLPAIRDAVAAQMGGGTAPGGGTALPTIVETAVAARADDAEERGTGAVTTGDSDLELGQDGSSRQTVGLRFRGVQIPDGATITAAWVQFTADEVKTGTASLTVAGHDADNAASFTTSSRNITSRPRTTATVPWTPARWSAVGARTTDQRTPDLSGVVQEIVDRPGWVSGNALAFVVTGTGTRTAEPYEGGAQRAAVLHIEYTG